MAQLTPSQRRWRARIEAGLRIAAPALDLVLIAGDRLSRVLERERPESLTSGWSASDGSDDRYALTDGRD